MSRETGALVYPDVYYGERQNFSRQTGASECSGNAEASAFK